jgi:hypothetical protein
MKALLAICMIFVAVSVRAGESTAPMTSVPTTVKGEVLEVREVPSYTYLRLKTVDGETWAAVGKAPVKKGAEVTIVNVMVMHDFESKSLNKTFKSILFGSLGGAGGTSPGADNNTSSAHSSVAGMPADGDVRVAKASGTNARTVAEVMTGSAALKDKQVLVRAKVVKYNAGIMGKNWIHLRDGSGSAADGSDDLLVTSAGQAKVGDILTAKGMVRTNRDFGSGYFYKVLIEDAALLR